MIMLDHNPEKFAALCVLVYLLVLIPLSRQLYAIYRMTKQVPEVVAHDISDTESGAEERDTLVIPPPACIPDWIYVACKAYASTSICFVTWALLSMMNEHRAMGKVAKPEEYYRYNELALIFLISSVCLAMCFYLSYHDLCRQLFHNHRLPSRCSLVTLHFLWLCLFLLMLLIIPQLDAVVLVLVWRLCALFAWVYIEVKYNQHDETKIV